MEPSAESRARLFSYVRTLLFHFPIFLTIFKTAQVSIILMLELSVLHKSCLELNFQAIEVNPRVPCTAVFLRSRASVLFSDFSDYNQNGSSFYNIDARIKCLT